MVLDHHTPSGTARVPVKVAVFGDFEAARATWSHFEQDCLCYAFQTITWIETWHTHLGRSAGVRPVLVAVTDQVGERLMFLPLGLETRFGARVLTWLGGRATDYHGPLLGAAWAHLGDRIDMKALWAEIRRHLPKFDAVHFEKQPATIAGFSNPFLALGMDGEPHWASAGRLGSSWEEYYRSRRKNKTRKSIRNRWCDLNNLGSVELVMDVREPEHIDRVMDALATMKEEKIAMIGGRSLFSTPGVMDFYRDMLKGQGQRGGQRGGQQGHARVMLSSIELDGQVIAAHWGVLHERRLYSMLPSYDGAYAGFSPGIHLMIAIMEWCCESGIDVFDFTLGEEAYKEKWANETLCLTNRVRLHRVRGLGYVLRTRSALVARRLSRRVPALGRLKPAWRQWKARRRGIRPALGVGRAEA